MGPDEREASVQRARGPPDSRPGWSPSAGQAPVEMPPEQAKARAEACPTISRGCPLLEGEKPPLKAPPLTAPPPNSSLTGPLWPPTGSPPFGSVSHSSALAKPERCLHSCLSLAGLGPSQLLPPPKPAAAGSSRHHVDRIRGSAWNSGRAVIRSCCNSSLLKTAGDGHSALGKLNVSPTTRPKVAKSGLQGMHECTQLGSVGKSGLVYKWLLCWGTQAVSSTAKTKFPSLYCLKPPLLWPPRSPPLRVSAQLGLTHSLLASLHSRRVLSRELLAGQARRASGGGEQLKPLCSSCRSDPWSPEQADTPPPGKVLLL